MSARRLRKQDLRFLLLCAATLFLVGAHIRGTFSSVEPAGAREPVLEPLPVLEPAVPPKRPAAEAKPPPATGPAAKPAEPAAKPAEPAAKPPPRPAPRLPESPMIRKLRRLIERGELSDRDAMFYKSEDEP